jgi:hypothetical protein
MFMLQIKKKAEFSKLKSQTNFLMKKKEKSFQEIKHFGPLKGGDKNRFEYMNYNNTF